VLFNYNTSRGFYRVDDVVWVMQAGVVDGIDGGGALYDHTTRFGWIDNSGTADPSQGIWFEAADPARPGTATWKCITQDGAGTTTNDTGVQANVRAWHTLTIANNGAGTITFSVDGVQKCRQATHVPAVPVNPAFQLKQTNSSTSNNQFGIDWFTLDMIVTR